MARSDSSKNNPASDSSKKVAKAAKAGQTKAKPGREQRELGFPMALAAVVFAGVGLVAFSWSTRDVQALSPNFGDHWHVSYGIYDCQTEGFLPNLADPQTSNPGIHTHGNGVAHIHPRGSDATGRNAQLEVFLDATRTEIVDDATMSFPNREALFEEGTTCGGEDAILQVARFNPGSTVADEVFTENLNDVQFLADQEAIVIALAPVGFEIPPPPQANLDTARNASPSVLQTDGLDDLNNLDLGTDGIGFDDDGNLVDSEGNIVIPEADIPDEIDPDAVDTGTTVPEATDDTVPILPADTTVDTDG